MKKPDDVLEVLGVEDAKAALKPGQWFIVRVTTKKGFGTMYEVKIRYLGKWLRLGRADSCDQVRTFIGSTSEDEFYRDPVAYYRVSVLCGAWITAGSFYVLDSMTDG